MGADVNNISAEHKTALHLAASGLISQLNATTVNISVFGLNLMYECPLFKFIIIIPNNVFHFI